MSNGRSFRRNRKGSPGKSLRKQRQRERSAQQFQAMIKTATDSTAAVAEEAAQVAAEAAVSALNRKNGAVPPAEGK